MSIPPKDIYVDLNLHQNQLKEAVADNIPGDILLPINGQFWYNSILEAFRVRANGATQNIGTVTGPNLTVDEEVTIFDGINGDRIKGSGLSLADILNRANHTGTQLANTISDFNTAVRTNKLNEMAAPDNEVSMDTNRLSNLAEPVFNNDAVRLIDLINTSTGVQYQKTVLSIIIDAQTNFPGGTLPPAAVGQRYIIVNSTPLNLAWGTITSLADNDIIEYEAGGWVVVYATSTLVHGALTWVNDVDSFYQWDGTTWNLFSGTAILAGNGLQKIGNTISAVAGDATINVGVGITVGVSPFGAIISTINGLENQVDDDTLEISTNLLKIKTGRIPNQFTDTITGDGLATSFIITHSFNNINTEVIVMENGGTYETVYVDVQRGLDDVTIIFGSAPLITDTFIVVVRAIL